jgi:hypothetical protein
MHVYNMYVYVLGVPLQLVEDDFTRGVSKSAACSGARVLDVNTIHPCDIGYIVSFLSIQTISSLLTSLDNISCYSSSGIVSVTLSYEQYMALLDIYLLRSAAGPATPRVQQLLGSLDALLAAAPSSAMKTPPSSDSPSPDSPSQAVQGDSRVSSLRVFYGDVEGGAGMFLRRLRALGWRQALLFRETGYLPTAAGASGAAGSGEVVCGSTMASAPRGSPFSHPVLSAMVFLEESLRVHSTSGGGDASAPSVVTTELEKVYATSMELLGVYNTIMKKRYSNHSGEMKSDQELQEEEEAAASEEQSDSAKDSMLDVMFSVEEAISTLERSAKATAATAELTPLLNLHQQEVDNDSKLQSPFKVFDSIFALFLLERYVAIL